MYKPLASLCASALIAGALSQSFAYAEEPQPPAPRPFPAQDNQKPAQQKTLRVMVLLKDQPQGPGNEQQGLAAVERVVQRWQGRPDFSVNRRFGYLVNGFSATVRQDQLVALASDPDVATVKPLKQYWPNQGTAGELTNSVQARKDYGVDGRGLVVSVIDTGIDINHQDMQLDDDVEPRIAPEKGFTEKVPFGWNYADNNAEVFDTGSQHGMHVAGIVAANGGSDANPLDNDRVNGIAPNAQVLAMKVFSNNPEDPSAYEDDIIAAIEDSVKHGADIINMSLGATNGTNQSAVGEGRAIANAQAAGVQVIVSAGNEGLNGSTDSSTEDFSGLLDDGTVGTPSTATDAWSVASVNNAQSLAYVANYASDATKGQVPYQTQVGEFDPAPRNVVFAGFGYPEEFPEVPENTYVLIERGEIPFSEKVHNAIAAGAAGVMVYNNASGGDEFLGMAGIDDSTIPVGFMYHSDGKKLQEVIAQGPTTLGLTQQYLAMNVAESLSPSKFTSWGASPELDFKPQIAGVGGYVWSTMNDNKYGEMSGTSMAAPHVAGAFALGRELYAERYADLDNKARNTLLRTAFSNTAQVLENDGVPFAPRQIGAGLIDTEAALATEVFATVDGQPTAALREVNGPASFTVTLENRGSKSRTFTTGGTCVVAESQAPEANTTACSADESISADQESVTVPAGGKAEVTFTVTPTVGADHWIQGWAQFTSEDADQPLLSVPYLGFVGDWNAEPIIDFPRGGEQEPLTDQVLGSAHDHVTTLVGSNNEEQIPSEWFSPNDDGVLDAPFPQLMMLRTATDVKYEVLRDGAEPIVIGNERDVPRPTLAELLNSENATHLALGHAWDGKVFNPATNSFDEAPEGKYTLRVSARKGEAFDWQTLDLPFGIDRTAPKIDSISKKRNDDGSIEYTVKMSDQGGAGISETSQAINSQTGEPLEAKFDEAGSTLTFTYPADKAKDGDTVILVAQDRALNSTQVTDFVTGKGITLDNAWLYNTWVGPNSIDPKTSKPLVADESITLTVVADEEITRATVNGQDVKLNDEHQGTVSVDLTEGKNDVEIVGYDAAGKEVDRSKAWIGYDLTAPKIEIDPKSLNAEGKLEPDARGMVKVSGKITDDFSSAKEITLSTLQDNIEVKDDGSFTYEGPLSDPKVGLLFLFTDLAGNRGVEVLEGATANPEEPAIVFEDPALESIRNFGPAITFVDSKLKHLTMREDGATLELKGEFTLPVGKFLVDGKEVPVDEDLRFSVPVELKNGINTIGYEVYDTDGEQIVMGSWKFFYDRHLPAYDVTADPAINADGAIYLRKPGKISLSGEAWDDEFGHKLKINGNTVSQFDSLWDPGQNRRKFSASVNGRDGETLRIGITDAMDNGVERSVPIVVDDKAPTVTIEGVPGHGYVASTTKLTARVKDVNVDQLQVLVDGEPVAYKVAAAPHPDASVEEFLEGESQAEDLDAPAADRAEELTVEFNVEGVGPHAVKAIASDKAGLEATTTAAVIVDEAAPVIEGPDELIINPDEDVQKQFDAAYSVTDDADPKPRLMVDLSTLVKDQAVEVTIHAMDASGKHTERVVKITLQQPGGDKQDQPKPAEPKPGKPAPGKPAPGKPAPGKPAPAKPQPAPVTPKPLQPAPGKPGEPSKPSKPRPGLPKTGA